MFLLGRMIALHDRDRFEVHAYSYGAEDSSAYRSLFDRFYDVHRMDDQEVAALARKAGLDIAIDLKGAHQGWAPGDPFLRRGAGADELSRLSRYVRGRLH
jgi:predicted O-linked N-acetylglucosamine transferase (SPINDLY family)